MGNSLVSEYLRGKSHIHGSALFTINLTFLDNNDAEPIPLIQIKIFQSNTHKNILNWLHISDEPRVSSYFD